MTADSPGDSSAPATAKASSAALAVGALGVVFGDIGTSPLYTLKTALGVLDGNATPDRILGLLSLVFWTMIVITTIKYVIVAMSIDNDGEGGILALMSLLGVKRRHRPAIAVAGLLGAALIYGDGAITPAISVLSAVEGINLAAPSLAHHVVPIAVAILAGLFAVQPLGTARIGATFGPIMTLWFLTIGALGLWGLAQEPAVLRAINPYYGLVFLAEVRLHSLFVLGGVFLCVTGAEALYADMGHFGKWPIRAAWSLIAFPCLMLNYAGQCAIVLRGATITDNIFYRLCPQPLLIPLVILATVATVIASQSIISGAFSMSRQAIQLGWLPRIRIKQTSERGFGQIYIGVVNWLLMLVTIALTVLFHKSDNLAAAYGIAVSATMLMTSCLLFVAMREIWHWPVAASAALAGLFLLVDSAFVVANSLKIVDGGYVPLLLAAVVYGVMVVWHRGSLAVASQLAQATVSVPELLADVKARGVPRVPGTAVFLTSTTTGVPPLMLWHLQQNRSLHQHIVVLTVLSESRPRTPAAERLAVTAEGENFWRLTAQYGFIERPDLPSLLREAHDRGCDISLDDLVYYVGHESVVPRERGEALPAWQEALFAAMLRNASHVTDYFRLPSRQVVEIGRQIPI